MKWNGQERTALDENAQSLRLAHWEVERSRLVPWSLNGALGQPPPVTVPCALEPSGKTALQWPARAGREYAGAGGLLS